MNFLSFFLAVPDANNAELHLCILDYMLYLVRQHETLLSPKVIHQLVVFSERMSQSNDARHVAKLSCMLRALAGSAPKKEFLNQLLQLTTEKKGSWDFVLERYATYFVESSNGNGGSKDEIEILLNKLYCMKKDKITLKIIEQLCENSSGNQTLESEEISADSLIWALIRSILTRLGDSCTKTQFTNTLLNLLANNDSITPPSVDKLIQLICELQLQVDFSGLIGLASSRRQELRDIATLTMITDRVLVPDAPQHCQLFELLTSLMQETNSGHFPDKCRSLVYVPDKGAKRKRRRREESEVLSQETINAVCDLVKDAVGADSVTKLYARGMEHLTERNVFVHSVKSHSGTLLAATIACLGSYLECSEDKASDLWHVCWNKCLQESSLVSMNLLVHALLLFSRHHHTEAGIRHVFISYQQVFTEYIKEPKDKFDHDETWLIFRSGYHCSEL